MRAHSLTPRAPCQDVSWQIWNALFQALRASWVPQKYLHFTLLLSLFPLTFSRRRVLYPRIGKPKSMESQENISARGKRPVVETLRDGICPGFQAEVLSTEGLARVSHKERGDRMKILADMTFSEGFAKCRTTKERGSWLYQHNPAGTFNPAESFWLIGAKHELRDRDSVDAANDAEALAEWARKRT